MPHRMLPQLSEKDFNLFQKLVKKKVGISIRPGKKNILGVKLSHRLRQLVLTSYFAYYRYLLKPEGIKELRHLVNTVTIDTTEFFRGERQFKFLREHILPELIRQKNKKNVSGFGHQDVPPDRSLTV